MINRYCSILDHNSSEQSRQGGAPVNDIPIVLLGRVLFWVEQALEEEGVPDETARRILAALMRFSDNGGGGRDR